jgi:hypothetical protein
LLNVVVTGAIVETLDIKPLRRRRRMLKVHILNWVMRRYCSPQKEIAGNWFYTIFKVINGIEYVGRGEKASLHPDHRLAELAVGVLPQALRLNIQTLVRGPTVRH